MSDDNDNASMIEHLSEQLAEYQSTVRDAVEQLGHEGYEPVDLRDALGEIERLLSGKSSCDRNDLRGLAEDLRAALWHRERAESLLATARAQAQRRTVERDLARAHAARAIDNGAGGLMMALCISACAEEDYARASWLLRNAVAYADTLVGVVALRMTWAYRDQIEGWIAALAEMRQRIIRQGRDPDTVLMGLGD